MSFFGFDTALPRDRQAGQQSRGIFENTDPFAEVARAQAQGLHDGDDDAYVCIVEGERCVHAY
jgi:DNA topoisomerase 2-associated protein PAT1